MSDTHDWLQLGTLTAPWGIKGDSKIHLDADPDFSLKVKKIYLGDERTPFVVESVALRAKNYTIRLRGLNTPEAVSEHRGAVLWVNRAEAPPLPEGHFFVQDLIGTKVTTNEGRELGEVTDVLQTGANDVYVVHDGVREYLIPAISEVVTSLDVPNGKMIITPMSGLLD